MVIQTTNPFAPAKPRVPLIPRRLQPVPDPVEIAKQNINEAKSDFLPTITISGYISDENTTKQTNTSGINVKEKG